ncbi:MAG: hypothetical protein LBQ84_09210 [Flavobacteriaceae bacterium]|jgi:hypothetical protein|nr:hypothetical protein [Flavobacteriaceae bacterium]
MNSYKVIILLVCFWGVVNCEGHKDKTTSKTVELQQEVYQQQNFIKMDYIKLIQNKWEIKNVKKVKRGKIEASSYYKIFKGNSLIFAEQGVLKLEGDSIGIWNDKSVTIYKGDSLKGKYHFMEIGGILQLIIEDKYQKGDYFIINLQNKQINIETPKNSKKDVIDFDK